MQNNKKMQGVTHKKQRVFWFILMLLFGGIFVGSVFCLHAESGPIYQISGFYLGATPDEINIQVEIDPLAEEKYYEVDASGTHLFFIKVNGTLRLYRIVKEQAINPNKVRSVLDNLKTKYGTPDKQQIKTSSVRPSNRKSYTTTVKNKAIWSISETQQFIAEIESKRVVYELLDHNPENIKPPEKTEDSEEAGFSAEGWDPDY